MSYKENILRLHSEGRSYSEICAELGCSKGTVAYHLGENQKEKTLTRTEKLRDKVRIYICEYKTNSICADCGEDYPYWMLEFDHLRDKEFNISRYRNITMSLDKIKEEIAKCEVVCANCHKNRTHYRAIKNRSRTHEFDASKYYD